MTVWAVHAAGPWHQNFVPVQIHYGRASLSPLSKLPAYFVFTKQPIDCQAALKRITEWASQASVLQDKKALLLLPDQPLEWALQGLNKCLQTDLQKVSNSSPLLKFKV